MKGLDQVLTFLFLPIPTARKNLRPVRPSRSMMEGSGHVRNVVSTLETDRHIGVIDAVPFTDFAAGELRHCTAQHERRHKRGIRKL